MLLIDFEWWKDANGYRLVEAEAAKPIILRADGIEVTPTLMERIGKPQRVVPNSGNRLSCRPLNKFAELYKAFASIETAESVLWFIKSYGPLTEAGLEPSRGEDVSYVLEHAESFRGWLDANHRRRKELATWIGEEGKKIGNLEASLTADDTGAMRLRVQPRTLLGALWVQLAQTIAGGTMIRACLHCGGWFECGPGTDRRLDAKFCSDEHRVLFNSLKRSNGE
ncbi:MAG: hypothetical protein WAL80_11270 [Xanthobacteraceae bacterium]